MTDDEKRDQMFELHLENWERNRMYAPEHGKESIMRKMTYKHTNALSTVIKLLRKYMRRDPSNELLEELQKDLELLGEVRTFVQHKIANPTLPFGKPEVEQMFDRLQDAICEVD